MIRVCLSFGGVKGVRCFRREYHTPRKTTPLAESFAAKHSLYFPLLTDEDHAVCEAYGVWVEKNMMGKTYMGVERSTFVIDKQGVLRHIERKVKVDGHMAAMLEMARQL